MPFGFFADRPATPKGESPFLCGPSNPSLIALNTAKFHKTPAVLQCLCSHDIIPFMIPERCTELVQPLDVSLNGSFKNILWDVLDADMDSLGQDALNHFDAETESAISQSCILKTRAVGKAWEHVCIQ